MSDYPVGDQADFVSLFMSLPQPLQSALAMTALAAGEMSHQDATQAKAVLDAVKEHEGIISAGGAHFINMCGNIASCLLITRWNQDRR